MERQYGGKRCPSERHGDRGDCLVYRKQIDDEESMRSAYAVSTYVGSQPFYTPAHIGFLLPDPTDASVPYNMRVIVCDISVVFGRLIHQIAPQRVLRALISCMNILLWSVGYLVFSTGKMMSADKTFQVPR